MSLFYIIVTQIKENKSDFTGYCPTTVERPITNLQKLYSPPRNLRADNIACAIFGETSLHGRFIACAQNIYWKTCLPTFYLLQYSYALCTSFL